MTCLRGASAIARWLEELPQDAPLQVFVIWERVLWTDRLPPSAQVLRIIWDRRAVQAWDPRRRVSAESLRAARPHGAAVEDGEIAWDQVNVYRPGVLWQDALPPPEFSGCPVFSSIDSLRARLGTGS